MSLRKLSEEEVNEPAAPAAAPDVQEQNGWNASLDEHGQRVVEPKHYPMPTEDALAAWEALMRERGGEAFMQDSKAMAGRVLGMGYNGYNILPWQTLAMAVYRCLTIWQQTETPPTRSRIQALAGQVGLRDARYQYRPAPRVGFTNTGVLYPLPEEDPPGDADQIQAIRRAAMAEVSAYLRDAPDDVRAATLALFVVE